MNVDTTKLQPLGHIIEPAEVISIPAGATPKAIIVELPGTDGARVFAHWSGFPALTAGNFVAIQRRTMGALQYVIVGTSGGTASLGASAASESASGVAELATQAETDAGTDDARIVTPLKLANAGFHGKYSKNLLYHSIMYADWTGANDVANDTYINNTVWNHVNNGQAPDITAQAASSTDPLKQYLRGTFDSATSQAGIVQFLKSADSVPYRGEKLSISADLWGTNITTLRMAILEWQGTADAVTSDVVATWGAGNPTLAANWVYLGTPAAITITTGRARYEVENLTVGIGANNLAVFIWTDAVEASGDLWNVARVQLERGPVATEFVAQGENEEKDRVKEFVRSVEYNLMGYKSATTACDFACDFDVEMRAAPTMVNAADLATTTGTGAKQIRIFMPSLGFLTATGNVSIALSGLLSNITTSKRCFIQLICTSWTGTLSDGAYLEHTAGDLAILLSARL